MSKQVAAGISATTGHLGTILSPVDSPKYFTGYEALFRDSCWGGQEKLHFWRWSATLYIFDVDAKRLSMMIMMILHLR
jgi:hypothetical protein